MASCIRGLLSTHKDSTPPDVHAIKLFVLESHESLTGQLEACLVDLMLAFYPVRRRKDIVESARHLMNQVARLPFHVKLDLLRPSLQSCGHVDVRALEELNRLRNHFAHRSFYWEKAQYKGRPLWSTKNLRRLEKDVFTLELEVDSYAGRIDEAKEKTEHKVRGLDLRRFWSPRTE